MRYQFIEQNRQEFPVVVMCRVLGISESGYYAWCKRSTCGRKREDAQLTQEIRQVFVTHRGRYGSPRIHDEELVENALKMAVLRRRPKAGLLHHSDRGCQYTSRAYRRQLEHMGMVVSMSRKGNCWDNAAAQSGQALGQNRDNAS